MTYVFISGDVGTGKTLLTTGIAMAADDRPILANYNLEHPCFEEVTPRKLANINRPTLVLLDEAYTWLESRIPGAVLPLFMSYILFQSRKRSVDIITTCQIPGSVDLRYRELADYWIEATNDGEYYTYQVVKNSRQEQYPTSWLKLSHKDAEQIYPYYNTYQTVGDLGPMLDAINPSDCLPEAHRIADEILAAYPGRKWTKSALTDYCMEAGYSDTIMQLTYNRLQRLS